MNFTQATNGWGPVERDMSNGEAAAEPATGRDPPQRHDVQQGPRRARPLGRALSTLPANCTRFKASVGVDDEVGSLGSVIFEVYAGATKIYD